MIERQLKAITVVDEIAMHKSEVDAANRNISNVALVLFVIAVLLMLISFVLINNTVRLGIYARRFSIHTMKLVGASWGFIRAPFVRHYMLLGLLAAIIACCALGVFCSGHQWSDLMPAPHIVMSVSGVGPFFLPRPSTSRLLMNSTLHGLLVRRVWA